MNKVECKISQAVYRVYKPGRYDSTKATCLKCGNTASCHGSGDNSIRSCLATLRSTCPKGESNFYVAKTITEGHRYKNKSDIFTREIDEGFNQINPTQKGQWNNKDNSNILDIDDYHGPNQLADNHKEDNDYKIQNSECFSTYEEAVKWAKNNPGRTIARSSRGNGFIIKKNE